ncbi:mCG1047563, isoform CRA_a, partial [Mus musculus]
SFDFNTYRIDYSDKREPSLREIWKSNTPQTSTARRVPPKLSEYGCTPLLAICEAINTATQKGQRVRSLTSWQATPATMLTSPRQTLMSPLQMLPSSPTR